MELILIVFVLGLYLMCIATAIIASLISNLLIGVAIGAIPLMCGFIKKKQSLGWGGFAASIALYWFFGFWLAQIASAIFTFLIVKDRKKAIEE